MKKKFAVIGLAVLFFFAGYMVSCLGRRGALAGYIESGNGIKVVELARTVESWDGSVLPSYPESQPEITILRITVPPGASLPEHKHPVINAGVLLEGGLTVVSEYGEKLYLRAGEAIVEVVDTWHHGVNESGIPAEIIVFYAGASGTPITVNRN